MLEFLAHDLAETSIVVLATYRRVEARRAAAVAEILARLQRRGRDLAIEGLSLEEVSSFVRGASGTSVAPAVAEHLHRQTEGNPFFLDEIVRLHLREGASLTSTVSLTTSGVRGAILQRLRPLDDDTRQALSTASVAGREFDLGLLEAVLEVPRTQLLERLAPAIDIELIASIAGQPAGFRFSHALVRETIYESLAPHERAALHRSFAVALEQRHRRLLEPHLAEIAHHFYEAAAGGGETDAADYARRAGEHALANLAYEDAAEQLARALRLRELDASRDVATDGELLLLLAEARTRAGQGDQAVSAAAMAAALARRIGSPSLLARAATALCNVGAAWTQLGRSDETLVRTLEEALQTLGRDEHVLRARVTARLATELFWARPAAETNALSAEAVELARRGGDPLTLAYALLARVHCVSDPDLHLERARLIDEILTLTNGRGELAVNAYLWRFGDELAFGRMLEAEKSRRRMISAVEALRQPGDFWLVAAIQSQQALLEGRLADAEACAERIVENPTHRYNAEQASLAALFLVRRDQGRQAELAAGLTVVAAESPVTVWRASLALLLAESGSCDDARVELDALVRDGLPLLYRDLTWIYSVASLAQACALCGTREQAVILYAALLPYADRNAIAGVFYYLGPVTYYLGILAARLERFEEADAHLETALHSARSIGAAPYVVRTLQALAGVREAHPHRERVTAAALRREASSLARRLGMVVAGGRADDGNGEADSPAAGPAAAVRASMICNGDFWIVSYRDRSTRLKDARGLHHLLRLLQEPGREHHVLEMAGSLDLPSHTDAPVLDSRARAEISLRLESLRYEIEEAESNNDAYRARKARAEIESIGEVLASAMGLGGRDRAGNAAAERARAAVTKALRTTIRRVREADPVLGDILSRTVRTGTFCSYVPMTEPAIEWDLEGP